MKKIKLLLFIILTAALTINPAVLAATADARNMTYSFKLSSTATNIRVGDVITVQLVLERTDENAPYLLYSMQDEIKYNSGYFTLVDGSISTAADVDSGIRTMSDNVHQKVIMSLVDLTGSGLQQNSSLTVGTFKLEALKAGTTRIESTDYKVNKSSGLGTYASTANPLDITISDPAGPGGGGGGGGGGGNTPVNPSASDDQALQDALTQTGQAKLSLENKTDGKALLSPNTLKSVNEGKPLILENKGVQVEFPAGSLLTEQFKQSTSAGEAQVEITVKELEPAQKEEILAKANMGESSGIFDIGGKIMEFTAEVTTIDASGNPGRTKMDSFNEPIKITVDLSAAGLTEADVAELCAVRYEKDEAGNITIVKLGGAYDPVTKHFTFYTDSFSYYGVVKATGLLKISLGIDLTAVKVNETEQYLDVPATIINSRTMVPLRFVAESLGAQVDWVEATRTVVIAQGGKVLELPVDQLVAGLDVPATIREGRTLVPIRYVAENLGAHVMWHPSARKVDIVK